MKISNLNQSIKILKNRLDKNTFKLCFGSSKLLSQRPGNHSDKFRLNEQQTVYNDVHSWTKDWKLARDNSIGFYRNKWSGAKFDFPLVISYFYHD